MSERLKSALMGFWVPEWLKLKFQESCKQREETMTAVLQRAMEDYINKHKQEVTE